MPIYNINSGPRGFLQADSAAIISPPPQEILARSINSANPLTTGLELAVYGGDLRNYAKSQFCNNPSPAYISKSIEKGGNSWYDNGTVASARFNLPANSLFRSSSSLITWVISFLVLDNSTIYSLVEGSFNNFGSVGLRLNTSGKIQGWNSAQGTIFTSNSSVSIKSIATIAVAVNPVGGTYRLAINGTFDSSGTFTGYTPTTSGPVLFTDYGMLFPFKGHLFGFWSWPNRYLSDPELIEVSCNPQQLFQSP